MLWPLWNLHVVFPVHGVGDSWLVGRSHSWIDANRCVVDLSSVRPTIWQPPSSAMWSTEPFSHGTGTLRCLQKELATYRYWSVFNCSETQMVSHIVEFCPLTKLNGGLSRLHSADEDAVSWLTNYGSWHTYEKRRSYCWTLIGSPTQGIQPLRVTPNLGLESPFWNSDAFVILLRPLVRLCQFRVAPQMLKRNATVTICW